jgi:hypothetical protein
MNLYAQIGALSALKSLGLEKIARMVVPGMKFSPEAMAAMEQAGTTLFSGRSANPAALAKARTAQTAIQGAEQALQAERAMQRQLPMAHPGRFVTTPRPGLLGRP